MTAHPFDYAQAQHEKPSRDWTGYCLVFVRSCFAVGAVWPDAATAWAKAVHKHPVAKGADVPRGVPVFWTGGSAGHGHIALSRGDGTCWTTDFVREGKVDVAKIDDITRGWGLTLVGWTEDVNGVQVYNVKPRTPATQAPAKQEVKHVYGPNVQATLDAAKKIEQPKKRKKLIAAIKAIFPGRTVKK